MPTVVGDGPTVTLSFANNFWGKDDAGVGPLLLRMHAAKQTCDELKAFYTARASIEDEYARRLLSLCKKPLGSQEMGGLKLSLDTVRGEVETMAKQHQNIAAQMKSELEEPLSAFASALKERRKIVQNTVEKLLKVKMQQTQHVNKTRDKFEQESFKIKGYLAQGHMVMGQEERKNKAKLEKTQVALAASNTEYENAVRILEETTARWNREWKAAADKFQDLEEERLDFTKSSLWAFANLASTVCVSDDASCEKIRISLEQMDAEEDIIKFITERGTGQEIPDPPKYINFIRGDGADAASDAGEEENYSVAQFPRAVNPAFRSSSPQPTNYDPHQEPKTPVTKDAPNLLTDSTPTRATIADKQPMSPTGDQEIMSPQQTRLVLRPDGPSGPPMGAIDQAIKANQEVMPASAAQMPQQSQMSSQLQRQAPPSGQVQGSAQPQVLPRTQTPPPPWSIDTVPVPSTPSQDLEFSVTATQSPILQSPQHCIPKEPLSPVNADTAKIPAETASSGPNARSVSRESAVPSVYSNSASVSSTENRPSGPMSPFKRTDHASSGSISDKDKFPVKKRTGFFQSQSPFRRKSTKERNALSQPPNPHPALTQLRPALQASVAVSAMPQLHQPEPAQHLVNIAANYKPVPVLSGSSNELCDQDVGSGVSHPLPPTIPVESEDPITLPSVDETSHQPIIVSPTTTEMTINVPVTAVSVSSSSVPSVPSGGVSESVSLSKTTATPSLGPVASKINPVTGNAVLALGVGGNLLPISDSALDGNGGVPSSTSPVKDGGDPLAQALAELQIVANSKQSSNRVSVDRYAGIATPAPGFAANGALQAAKRGTPPPHYEGQVQRLGAPPPAHTAKAMKEASDKYVGQTRNMFGEANYSSSSLPRSGTRHGGHGPDHRSMSPGPAHGSSRSDDHRMSRRSASPNTASSHARSSSRVSTHNSSMNKRGGDGGYSNRPSTSHSMRGSIGDQHGQGRPGSSHVGGDMAMQLMSSGDPDYGMQLERAVSRPNSRPGTSNGSRAMGVYEGHGSGGSSRQRSKSLADPSRQYSRDGRPILHFARAMYPYQAAISEELGFSKGDTLAVLRHQDDGWWEAEVYNAGGRVGLVPSNYLKAL